MIDSRLQVLLDRYFDEALTEVERDEFERMLLASPRAREEFWAQARFHARLRQLGAGEWGRRAAEAPVIVPLSRFRAWRWPLSVAAALVLALSLMWWPWSKPATVARLERIEGEVVVMTHGLKTIAEPGQRLLAGQSLRVGAEGFAVVEYPDTTRLEIQASSTVRWPAQAEDAASPRHAGAWRVFVDEGGLTADVAHQPELRPLVLVTPHAEVIVRGTRFNLANLTESTYVQTDDGVVEVNNRSGGNAVAVPAGFYATIVPGLSLQRAERVPGPSSDLPAPMAVARDVEMWRDVEYGRGGGRSLTMHILRSKTLPSQPMPVVVRLHSGAWWRGNKDIPLPGLITLAQRGYLGVSVEYRLSGEAIFPAQIEDAKCAIRFLRAHAQQLRLDPERIGVWGTASGGHLAALLGLTGDVAKLDGTGGWPGVSSRVQAVVDWCGPADLMDPRAWQGASYASSITRLLGGENLASRSELAQRASPISYARADAPPFLILHGDRDRQVPVAQSRLLASSLQNAGANVTLKIAGDTGSALNTRENIEMAFAFFDQHLNP